MNRAQPPSSAPVSPPSSAPVTQPRALRVTTLSDRLVLHDTSAALRGGDPAARNALIDAANSADAPRRPISSASAVNATGEGFYGAADVAASFAPSPRRHPSPPMDRAGFPEQRVTRHHAVIGGIGGSVAAAGRDSDAALVGGRGAASFATATTTMATTPLPRDVLKLRAKERFLVIPFPARRAREDRKNATAGACDPSGALGTRNGHVQSTGRKMIGNLSPEGVHSNMQNKGTEELNSVLAILPFETFDPAEAGIDDPNQHVVAVDAAAGFLGVIQLHSAAYCVVVSQVRRAATLPSGPVVAVQRVKMLKLGTGPPSKEDREFMAPIAKLLESGTLYYSLDCDITRSLEKAAATTAAPDHSPSASHVRVGNSFWWTWPMVRVAGAVAATWALRTIYGFVGTESMRFASASIEYAPNGVDFSLTLISRRSRRRAGTRYITRGVDSLGDVANFVETEQVVWQTSNPGIYSAFALIRGSVPVFWRQNNGIARPSPELDGTITASRAAFSTHFRNMVRSYGGVTAISLVDLSGSESILAEAFQRHFDLDINGSFDGLIAPRLVAFDFHTHCGGKEYERGLGTLLTDLRKDLRDFAFFTHGLNNVLGEIRQRQRGVFRVNCVDCLDRTNVVQSVLARVVLDMQLVAVFHHDLIAGGRDVENANVILVGESSDRFKRVWGDNADAISKQYSGTGAMKTDYTRTGKRSTSGIVGDGVKSVVRMYYKNFVDEGRQEAIDILCGYASVRPRPKRPDSHLVSDSTGGDIVEAGTDEDGGGGREWEQAGLPVQRSSNPRENVDSEPTFDDSPLWCACNAFRINGGGDRQLVVVELRDNVMQVVTQEGVNFEYPRHALEKWEKHDEPKSGDRRNVSRLRLVHLPSTGSPAAASPLDLLFRSGSTSRENFVRAYLAWSKPAVLATIGRSVRIRVLSARGVGRHRMADWGLKSNSDETGDRDGDDMCRSENIDSVNGTGDCRIPTECEGREIVALVMPEAHSGTREWGLAAVPTDIDASGYTLISARAVSSRGPAIAVLASRSAAPLVMSVKESMVGRAGSLTGGGAVGVSLLVSGTSVCFVSARLAGAKDLFRVLTTLKLCRNMFDVTNHFEHFYVAGVMGDLQWRSGDVPDDGPSARQYLRLGEGSRAYSLGCGLSVMRNSFPTLQVKDLLSRTSFWRQRNMPPLPHSPPSSVSGDGGNDDRTSEKGRDGPALVVTLADDVVSGGLPPTLPDESSTCVVTLSELRGENIKMPPGIDPSTPLNMFFAVYSDLVGSDGIATKPTARATDQPEWREIMKLTMIPSDVDEVKRSFLLGQVLIPTPLSEPVPAGHCVLPIAYAAEGQAEFNIPLRLAGIPTGRIRGVIHFEVAPAESVAAVSPTTEAQLHGHSNARSSSLPRPSPSSLHNERADSGRGRHGSKVLSTPRTETVDMGGNGPASTTARTNLEDMNERLDVARRKGARKVKSVVGMLSSLLNQGPSPRAPGNSADAATGQGHASYEDRLRTVRREMTEDRTDMGGVDDPVYGQFEELRVDQHKRSGSDSPCVAAGCQSSSTSIELSRVGRLNTGDNWSETSGALGSACWKQNVPPSPSAPSPRSTGDVGTAARHGKIDPVLAGLAASRSLPGHQSAKSLSRRIEMSSPLDEGLPSEPTSNANKHKACTKPAIIGEDDLLAGISSARQSSKTVSGDSKLDEWGGFEMASATPEANGRARTDFGTALRSEGQGQIKKSSVESGSLLDL